MWWQNCCSGIGFRTSSCTFFSSFLFHVHVPVVQVHGSRFSCLEGVTTCTNFSLSQKSDRKHDTHIEAYLSTAIVCLHLPFFPAVQEHFACCIFAGTGFFKSTLIICGSSRGELTWRQIPRILMIQVFSSTIPTFCKYEDCKIWSDVTSQRGWFASLAACLLISSALITKKWTKLISNEI